MLERHKLNTGECEKKPNWIKVRGNSETHTQDIFHLHSGKGQINIIFFIYMYLYKAIGLVW
jgi:hypothetical protein